MSTTTIAAIPRFGVPRPSTFERIVAWFSSPNPVTVQSILVAAEKGQLDAFLTEHYTIYYDAQWREYMLLCRDLADDGCLKAEFEEHFDGTPLFIKGIPRITIAGRKYLAELRERHPVRRLLVWAVGFVFSFVKSIVGGHTGH